jgi:prevent-host-death family protein
LEEVTMEKRMNADTVATDWDRVLLDVAQDDNTIIIEQDGEPIAALVPVRTYKHLRRAQETVGSDEARREHAWGRAEARDETAD